MPRSAMPWVLAALAASSLGPSTTPAWGVSPPPSPLFFILNTGSRMSLSLRGGGKRRAVPVDEESATPVRVSPRRGGAAAPVSPVAPDSATKSPGRKGTRTAPGDLPGKQVEGKAGAKKRIRLEAGTISDGASAEATTKKGAAGGTGEEVRVKRRQGSGGDDRISLAATPTDGGPPQTQPSSAAIQTGLAEGRDEEGGVAGRSGIGRGRDASDKGQEGSAAGSDGTASKAKGARRGSLKAGFLEGGLGGDDADGTAPHIQGGASRAMEGGAQALGSSRGWIGMTIRYQRTAGGWGGRGTWRRARRAGRETLRTEARCRRRRRMRGRTWLRPALRCSASGRSYLHPNPHPPPLPPSAPVPAADRIFIGRMTSDRKLKESREGSK